MQSQAKTVKEYLDQLPSEQRGELEAVRKVVRKNLPKGYVETMQYSMITYVVPLKIYPTGYLGKKDVPLPYIGLASQKNYLSLYLMNIYGDHKLREAFLKAYKKSGKKLDMGKSCLRFKKAADLSLDVIGEAVAKMPVEDYIALHQKNLRK